MATIYIVSRTWASDYEPATERVYFKKEKEAMAQFKEMKSQVDEWIELIEVIELDTSSLEETVIEEWEGDADTLYSEGEEDDEDDGDGDDADDE